MPATTTIKAIDPQTGAVFTRRTARAYVAAVVFTGSQGQAVCDSWCGRPDLAQKALAKARKAWPSARLAPVVDPEAPAAPASVGSAERVADDSLAALADLAKPDPADVARWVHNGDYSPEEIERLSSAPAAQALPPSHAERVADDILAALDELSARWEAQPQQAPAAIVPAGPQLPAFVTYSQQQQQPQQAPAAVTRPAGPISYLQAVASGATKAQGLKRPTLAALRNAAAACAIDCCIEAMPKGYRVSQHGVWCEAHTLAGVAALLLQINEKAWAVKPAAPVSPAERVADEMLALSRKWEAQAAVRAAIVPAGPAARKTAPAAVPADVKAHLARFGLAVDGLLTVGASNAKLAKGKALAWPVILHHLPAKALAQAVAGPKAGPTAPRSRIDGLAELAKATNTYGLALAHNGCPWASAGCAAGCLAWAGHGGMSTTVAAARARRTLAMLADGRTYARAVLWAIARAYRQAQAKGLPLAVRLRGTDDSPVHLWRFDISATEAQSLARRYGLPVAPGQGLTLPEALALAPAGAVRFYEYSKAPVTGPHGLQAQASAGFDVTASLAADRPGGIDQALAAVAAGFRVAVPAGFAKGQPLPEALILRNDDGGVRLLCIDGDTTDHRWADPAGPQPGGFDGVAVILRTKRSRGKGPEADAFSLTPLVGAWQPLAGGGQAAFTTVKWEA